MSGSQTYWQMTNACAKKRSFIAKCPNCKNQITLQSGNKRDFVLWLELATKMRTNGQKDVLAPRHFSCHQRELPRAFWVLSQRGGMETVNRKPRHQPRVPEVPRTCPKQPEWQVLSIYRRPVRKSVTALCRMQLMNCQVRHMPALAPSLPPFLPPILSPPPSLPPYITFSIPL